MLLEAIRRLRAHPLSEWVWMAEAAVLLTTARLLVRLVPFRHWRRWLGPIGPRTSTGELTPYDRALALRTARCIRRVSARAPFRAVCLPKAMVTRWMLARRGIATELHIGAQPAADGPAGKPIALHAWTLCGPLCLSGGEQRARFSALTGPRSLNA